jgi:hypothetical protein
MCLLFCGLLLTYENTEQKRRRAGGGCGVNLGLPAKSDFSVEKSDFMPPSLTSVPVSLTLPADGATIGSPRAESSVANTFQFVFQNIDACLSHDWVKSHEFTKDNYSAVALACTLMATLHKAGALVQADGESSWLTVDELIALEYGIKHFIRPPTNGGPDNDLKQKLNSRLNKAFNDSKFGDQVCGKRPAAPITHRPCHVSLGLTIDLSACFTSPRSYRVSSRRRT